MSKDSESERKRDRDVPPKKEVAHASPKKGKPVSPVKEKKKAATPEEERPAVKEDDAEGQFKLGLKYRLGNGVAKDNVKAFDCFLNAASEKHLTAQYLVGECFWDGTGVEKDSKKAGLWFARAAKRGNPQAQFKLGLCFQNGDGVQRDEKQAMMWFKKAGAQGHVDALKHFDDLKKSYKRGRDEDEDDEDDDWVIKSCDSGTVTVDGLTFESTSKGKWKCATRGSCGWSSGVHTWHVTLDKFAANISIGISRKDIDFNDANENSGKRYDMYGGYGYALDPDNEPRDCFSTHAEPEPLDDGTKVSICLNLETRSLYFGLNKRLKKKPTFTDLPNGEWFPYFALEKKGAQFTVEIE
jgi:hypothetical protein